MPISHISLSERAGGLTDVGSLETGANTLRTTESAPSNDPSAATSRPTLQFSDHDHQNGVMITDPFFEGAKEEDFIVQLLPEQSKPKASPAGIQFTRTIDGTVHTRKMPVTNTPFKWDKKFAKSVLEGLLLINNSKV